MFKGIYNEAEFYTNFYFENKLSADLLLKIGAFPQVKERTDKFKALDSVYWSMRDNQKNKKENLVDFYSNILGILSFECEIENNPTLKEANITSIAKVSKNAIPDCLFFLTSETEEGSFESIPLSLNIEKDEICEDRDFNNIVSEYFDELENPPKWILLGAPTTLYLFERNKWSRGQFLKFSWDEIFQQKADDLFTSIIGLVSKDSLCPNSGSSLHDEIDDNSHRQAHEVTIELRESVRESIELLINEMIHQKKEAHESYLKKGSENYARELSHDALFYVYRLIFLLYLESQGEDSNLLPLKSEIYRHGYSLEKLLELIHDMPDEKTKDYEGSFVHESLDQIFSLIFNGFDYVTINKNLDKNQMSGQSDFLDDSLLSLIKNDTVSGLETTDGISNTGFLLKGIKSDLFNPETIKHLKGIKLRNGALLQILHKLSLSTVGKGRNKKLTRVSYSNLGINQLGAVYEGLLSYSGFFAEEDLHALKPTSVKQSDLDAGKEQSQIYLAPKSLVEKYKSVKEKKYKLTDENNVLGDDGHPKVYKKGSFIYRLAGRDRQKLASFYTPESLTKCTVKYSLKVLFETKNTLDDLWKVKVLEPAMGSGAFLNEAVNQLSDKILELEVFQKIGDLKTPKEKQKRLNEIKYRLISENIYGVDLNPTAIELARFSLWLNCIGAGKEPPKFDGRLKVGNSLIGARFKKGADGVSPWLLLDDGMMNYGKRLKDYDADWFQKIQDFRKELLLSKIESSDQKIKELQQKTESLLRELITSNNQSKKKSAYDRLKLCGDLWCSAFFLTEKDLKIYPKKHKELYEAFTIILEGGSIDQKLLGLIEEKYNNERFFHWEIEFPEIIASGGFDLILGNPPWLAIEWQDSLYVSDKNVLPAVIELNAAETRQFVIELSNTEVNYALAVEYIRLEGYSNLLDVSFYALIKGLQKNTYKAFDVLGLYLMTEGGSFGVIQEDGIFEDKQAGGFREIIYKKLRFHFQFQNELHLFSEVAHTKRYSVNVFSNFDSGKFDHIGNLFLPSTIDECYSIETSESLGGIKNERNKWNTRGDRTRIIEVDNDVLDVFKSFLNQKIDSIFLNLFSQEILAVIKSINIGAFKSELLFKESQLVGSECFHEVNAQDNNIILKNAGKPNKVDCVILSGPHISTANPFFQESKIPYINKSSYQMNDLLELPTMFIPTTVYQSKVTVSEIDKILPTVGNKPYRSCFKLVCKGMLNLVIERTLYPAIIPPGFCHINGLKSCASNDLRALSLLAGYFQSIFYDFIVRVKNKTNFFPSDFGEFPIGSFRQFEDSIIRRVVSLNALTDLYDELWLLPVAKDDELINGKKLLGHGEKFNITSPLRNQSDRILAMIELDVLVGMSFGLELKQIETVFSVYFSVLAEYDRKDGFDRRNLYKTTFLKFKKRDW